MKGGLTIAFIGTDGAGKSTVIGHITPWLETLGFKGVQYEHLRPNWLPPLGVVAGKSSPQHTGPVENPHGQKASGFLGSLVRLSYYSLDYTLGYWFKTWWKFCRKGKVCLFDRYFYDITIDPKRMRIQLPAWILKMFFILSPRPHIIICLGGDPNQLYRRKPETSLEEVERQTEELKKLVVHESRAGWVDTTQSIEQTVKDVRSFINRCISS